MLNALSLATLLWMALAGPLHAAPEKPMTNEPIAVYDLSPTRKLDLSDARACRRAWDTCHLVAALQGIVNRERPRLYLRYLPADDFWWEKGRRPGQWLAGRPVEEVGSLDALLARFRKDVQGVVLYDERVPATSNVASTLAGVESLLPVRYDPAPDSLYTALVEGDPRLPVRRRLLADDGGPLFTGRGHIPGTKLPSTGSAKADAYAWARLQLLESGKCEPTRMAYYLDAYWLRQPRAAVPEHHTLTNHDFFVSRRAFFFDLSPWEDEAPVDDRAQPKGADAAELKAVLLAAQRRGGGRMVHVGGFVPWAFKYTNYGPAGGGHEPVPSEWRYAEILSAYNAFMDADAIGLGAMANASFYRHFPLEERYPQPPAPDTAALRARGYLDADGHVAPKQYFAFYVGDYDAAAWVYSQMPRIWEDPARGSVPLSWAINPNLAERVAPALDYLRETRTPNDVFIAGDSGAGYLNPGLLEEPRPSGLPSGVPVWEAHCRDWYRRFDLSVTGFVIDGFARGMGTPALDAYARFSPGGIVAQKIPRQGVHAGMPYIRMGLDLGGSPEKAAGDIARTLRASLPTFHVYRTILQTPTWHRKVVEEVRRLAPQAEVIDLVTLLALVKVRAAEQAQEAERFAQTRGIAAVPGDERGGLQAVPAGDGPVRVEERSGRRAWVVQPEGGRIRYLYFDAADAFLAQPGPVRVTVEYLDRGAGRLGLEYDADDAGAPHGGAYKPAGWQALGDSGEWRTWTLTLPDARFRGGQNESADFRLLGDGEVVVGQVTVMRR